MIKNLRKKIEILVVTLVALIFISIVGLFVFLNTSYFKVLLAQEIGKVASVYFEINGDVEFSTIGMRPAIAMYGVSIDKKLNLYKLEISPVFNKEIENAPLKFFISADGLRTRNFNFGDYNSDFYVYKSGISMPNIEGEVGSAELDGKLEYINNVLKLKLKVDNVPYSNLSRDMGGKFKASLDVAGEGSSISKIEKSLKGNMLFIGGKGHVKNRNINLWTSDLLKTIFLSKKDLMKFECIIADFSLDKGIAYTNSLFLDSKETSIIGEGNLDIKKKTLDMNLNPKPKSANLIDLNSSIMVSGKIGKLKAVPNVADVAKNIGKAVFTAINPAALLLPLIQNLSPDRDLCKEYLKQKGIKTK